MTDIANRSWRPHAKPALCTWSDQIVRIHAEIAQAEASLRTLDVDRRAEVRAELRRLAVQLERLKVAALGEGSE